MHIFKMADELEGLRREIEQKSLELESLKNLLALKEKEYASHALNGCPPASNSSSFIEPRKKDKLNNRDILRYSRQLILPEIGVKGQIHLYNTSVLIVGAGGLGCPVAQYLAAAGVGCIGIVDYDTVEISNLHRQVLHTEGRVNIFKAESIKIQLNQLNSTVKCIPYNLQLTSSNALEIIEKYDIVLDATDNVATRYLLNDACVLAKKPLVSGSALRFEGQLTVYNYMGGPCYRCLFPSPPPPESVGNCSDSGVLGPVPGVIGTLQALEAIKIAVGIKPSYSQKMLIYDALDGRFLTIKLRPRQSCCSVCGDNPTINKLQDYELFCGASATDKTPSLRILQKQQRISVQEYKQLVEEKCPHILVDVREPVELDICSLPGSLNIPLRILHSSEQQKKLRQAVSHFAEENKLKAVNVYVLCKQGNDSQKAVHLLIDKGFCKNLDNLLLNGDPSCVRDSTLDTSAGGKLNVTFKDIADGLQAWAKHIDKDFPVY
ncbi:adenylyltransferase and sulfurtransferase MOCS3-like [Porites lutea]|uniref:adenylyltransferase and sulfurtransferase MOCS3-like n=1 Tax=Porites lutea TaxID=51062 RepID=UPI003CC5BC68